MEVELVVLRDIIGMFEITRKEDFKVSPVGAFMSLIFFFPLFFFGLCGGLQSCLAHVKGWDITELKNVAWLVKAG